MRASLLACLAAGCAAHAGLRTDVAALYPAPERRVEVICSPTTPGPPVRTLELAPLEVIPVPWGPRVSERPPDFLSRRTRGVLDETQLSACYRWARAADPALAPGLILHLVIDELGRVSHTIDAAPPEA